MMRPRLRHLLTVIAVLVASTWPQPAEAATPDSFIDDDTSRFEAHIETAREHGIVSGCNPPDNDMFCPSQIVTRGNLIIMLARALGTPPGDGDHFVDDDGHHAEGAIEGLMAAGVSMGCDTDRFCPDRPATRGEMAALITRAMGWGHSADSSRYLDLEDSPFGAATAELAHRGGLEACDAPVNRRLCPRHTVRRDEAVFAIVSVLGLQPISAADETSDAETLGFGDSFDELKLWDGRSPSYRNQVQLTDDGFRASALEVTISEGSHFGADFRLDLSRAAEVEPERLYFRYFLRLDPDWATQSSGKLPGFSGVYGSSGKGGYQSSPSEPGWSARLMFSPTGEADPRAPLGYYVYHLGQGSQYGDGMRWNEAGKLLPGEWYCLEGEVELNTLGLADGALRAWVDGTPAFDRSGLEFRRPDEPEIRIESFWFNVYYGGKTVPDSDLGLTIDEVVVDTQRIGCQVGEGTSQESIGDFNADGYSDRLWWSTCPGGSCFWLETTSSSGETSTRQVGDGAWFSLETHRLGLANGDIDGDQRADIIYRGRCEGSVRCWRVHQLEGDTLGAGEDWGDGARFSPSTAALTLGDWNGDGLDDLVYQGICGDDAHPCWRMHPSTGAEFDAPLDWGGTPDTPLFPLAADITADGQDDLVYQAPCQEGTCWFLQTARSHSFGQPQLLGTARETELEHRDLIDFDGDGQADLVSWGEEGDKSRIEVRYSGPAGLTDPVLLAELDYQVREVLLRRVQPGSPVQALVQVACEGDTTCFEYLVSSSANRLSDPSSFREAMRDRFTVPSIA